MTKKLNVRSYLVDNTLDLSLNDLQDVPVKEIASCPKATILDLSNNKIITLGKLFPSSLSYLVKLDLSNNQLAGLPDNFGLLSHLKHLDLYHNKIRVLPLSFGNLRMLRWLDLKDNPLDPKLAEVSGPCLDAQQCQQAAKNVVNFLERSLRLQQERETELEAKRLLQEKEKAAKTQAQQAKKKKKKSKNTNKEESNEKQEMDSLEADEVIEDKEEVEEDVSLKPRQRSKLGAFCSSLFKLIVLTILVGLLIAFAVNLLDESTYNELSTKMSHGMKLIGSILPKNMSNSIQKNYRYLEKVSRRFFRKSTVNFFHLCELTLSKVYVFYNEFISESVYMDTLRNYWHITYIKVVDFAGQVSGSTLPPEGV